MINYEGYCKDSKEVRPDDPEEQREYEMIGWMTSWDGRAFDAPLPAYPAAISNKREVTKGK